MQELHWELYRLPAKCESEPLVPLVRYGSGLGRTRTLFFYAFACRLVDRWLHLTKTRMHNKLERKAKPQVSSRPNSKVRLNHISMFSVRFCCGA